MSSRILVVSDRIRKYAGLNSISINTATNIVFDERFRHPENYRDEHSKIGWIETTGFRSGGPIWYSLYPKLSNASIAELYKTALHAISDSGFTYYTKEPRDWRGRIDGRDFFVRITKGANNVDNVIGNVVVMLGGKPSLGDEKDNGKWSIEEKRGLYFAFDENYHEEAGLIIKTYHELLEKLTPKITIENKIE